MDRRAAGALLALAACIACSAAAPTASNHTALDLYEGAPEGCYYNFQHYGEGDRIMTNEPCLNCTCHNRMLMCYLRVCPFTKPIGQDCTVEKRADQCCPIVTCPDVPVDLLTSTSTTSPAEYGATGLGKLDKYGCSIHGKYFPEGSKVPPTPNKPCEHCYCIRNMTTCVMQECTLHVDGCTPIYHKDVCCPVRYSCDHPEDEVPLLDDMSTTVRPTPGFLLTTTTMAPVTQMTQDCVHNDQIIADGASITTEKACEHCYCMKGDIVCVVQECGAPMENEGKNCTSLPPREGQCCPDTYICEGDELSTEIPSDSTTNTLPEKLTTLLPPRRSGDEGSGYRHEPSEGYTESPSTETELEGSGDEEELMKPLGNAEITTTMEETDQYLPVSTRAPTFEEPEATTKAIDRNAIPDDVGKTDEPQSYHPTTNIPEEEGEKTLTETTQGENLKGEHDYQTSTSIPETYDKLTTEPGELLNTVPDVVPEEEHEEPHKHTIITTGIPILEEKEPSVTQESEEPKTTLPVDEQIVTHSTISDDALETENLTPVPTISDEIERDTAIPETSTEKESVKPESNIDAITNAPIPEESESPTVGDSEKVSDGEISKDKDISKPDQYIPSTTEVPLERYDKLTTEPNQAQNTVAVAEEEISHPHIPSSPEEQKTTIADLEDIVTEKTTKEEVLEHEEVKPTVVPISEDSPSTTEPDKGLNTIPSEIDEESSSQTSPVDRTTSYIETKSTERQEVDIKLSTPFSEPHVTKVDQYTITTEPSFRKEDEASISTERLKEETGPTTIKPEFVDEGLIPTSGHDEKLSTSSDVASIDEDITTLAPEYERETIDDRIPESKPPSTESVLGTTPTSEHLPATVADTTSEPEVGLSSSTEKSMDDTGSIPLDEEPSRIPGEGDCLLNGVTYRNNTIVPNTNNCHTGCKCVSSIVKCDPIICSPPPDYMDNCQSIYDSPDSCCPTYVCDHARETIPPQSDNQMSGTESPLPSPTIECRGDQCELSEPTKATDSSVLCTSGNCQSPDDHKTETSECGPEGCKDSMEKPAPSQPSVEQPECTDGKCEPSKDSCTGGKCELPPSHSQASTTQPCEGDNCKDIGSEIPTSESCKDENECKKIDVPLTQSAACEGDSCTNVDCGSSGCDTNVVSPPSDGKKEPCKDENGCKPQEITPSECAGGEPCRRKDTQTAEELPSKCEGSDCVQSPVTSMISDIHHLSTESSIPEEIPSEDITEKAVTVEEEKLPSEKEMEATTPVAQAVTEKSDVPTEHSIYETTKAEVQTEKATDVYGISTDAPTLAEEEGTKISETGDEDTDKPISIEEITTKVPDLVMDRATEQPATAGDISTKVPEVTQKPSLDETQGIKTPDTTQEELTNIPSSVEDQEAQMPQAIDEEHSDKPGYIDEKTTETPDSIQEYGDKSTKMPDSVEGHTHEPVLETESGTKIPDMVEKQPEESELVKEGSTTPSDIIVGVEQTDVPYSVEEQEVMVPESVTDKPASTEEEGSEVPLVTEDDTDKTTKTPDGIKVHIDEPTSDEETGTRLPDFEKLTDKPIIEEEGTTVPDIVEVEQHSKPSVGDTPDVIHEEEAAKPTPVDEQYTKAPVFIETTPTLPNVIRDHTDESQLSEEAETKIPDVIEEHTTKEESIKIPDIEREGYTDKPHLVDDPVTKIPESTDKDHAEKITPVEGEATNIPSATEVYAEISTKIPEIVKEDTEAPSMISETKKPDTVEEHESISDKEESTESPDVIGIEFTDKPFSVDETETTIPELVTDKTDIADAEQVKPILVEEDLPEKESEDKKPDTSRPEDVTEPVISIDKDSETNDVIKDSSTKKPILIEEGMSDVIEDSGTKKPILIEEGMSDVIEDSTGKLPMLTEGLITDKPSDIEDSTDEPVITEKEHTTISVDIKQTEMPSVSEGYTHAPEPTISDKDGHLPEEGSGTEIPEEHITDSEKETKVPEDLIDHTKTTDTEPDVITKKPDHDTQTETYLTPLDEKLPTISTTQETATSEPTSVDSPQSSVTDHEEGGTVAPNESVTESVIRQEETTKGTKIISEETVPPLQQQEEETYKPAEHVTPSQEPLTNKFDLTKQPEFIATTELEDNIIKSTESTTISDKNEGYTSIPEQEFSATISPVVVNEPQEGGQSELPDLTVTGHVDEESTTKVYKDDITKPSTPESHITDIVSEYESSSALPEHEIVKLTEIPEVVNVESQKTGLSKPHDAESVLPTEGPEDSDKQDSRPSQPDIFTPEEEEMITGIMDSAATGAPVKDLEKEDETSTGLYEQSTDRVEPFTTKKFEETTEIYAKTTKMPLESYTENDEKITKLPDVTEIKPSESYVPHKPEISTVTYEEETATTSSPAISQQTLEPDTVSGEPHRRTETDKTTPDTSVSVMTESPESLEVESEEQPISQEDKTTTSSILSDNKLPGAEIHDTPEPVATEKPESLVTPSIKPEPEVTESSFAEQHTTEAEVTDVKSEEPELTDIQKTTSIPDISATPEETETVSDEIVPQEVQKSSTEHPTTLEEMRTEIHSQGTTEASLSLVTEKQPDVDVTTEKEDNVKPILHETATESHEQITEKSDEVTESLEVTTSKKTEDVTKSSEQTSGQTEFSETTPYLIELEEHTHKMEEDISTILPVDEKEHTYAAGEETSPPSKEDHTTMQVITTPYSEEEQTLEVQEPLSTKAPSVEDYPQKIPEDTSPDSPAISKLSTKQPEDELQESGLITEKTPEKEIESSTAQVEIFSGPSEESPTTSKTISGLEESAENIPEVPVSTKLPQEEITETPAIVQEVDADKKHTSTSKATQELERTTPALITDSGKLPVTESTVEIQTEKEYLATEKPIDSQVPDVPDKTTIAEEEVIFSTTKATTIKQEELLTPSAEDSKPDDKPTYPSEIVPPTSTADIPKPSPEVEPTEEIPAPEDDGHFPPSVTGYGEPDYAEEDQAFGPGTCRYGGKVYVSAQQIPRDDPCDFCFCFRSDIICLQQSCPPPIHGCHEEPIQGFCCPRYECPVSMATTVNVTTTTTTTTTTLPPHFPTHSYKGAAQRKGCQIKGHSYKVGEVVRSSSGPCLHCTCGGDGQMKCDPKACTPEPMLRQMIAAAVSAKRRR